MNKLLLLSLFTTQLAHADLILYTDRPTARLQPIADEFTSQTGEKVQIIEMAYPQLKARIEAEGQQSPADLIFVKDFVYLNEMSTLGWFKPFQSKSIRSALPSSMIQSKNLWAGVSFRTRTVVYNTNTVNPSEIQDYKDLASETWAGRICVRTGAHPYNQALVSSFIHNYGYDATKEFMSQILSNLAEAPMANDTAVLNAIANGQCDVGIVNHYYLAPLVEANPAFPVKPIFVNQNTTGSHVNGTGIGIYKLSKNEKVATEFMEFLLTDKIQLQFSAAHYDYPAKTNLIPTSLIRNWGTFTADATPWENFEKYFNQSLKLINEINYK